MDDSSGFWMFLEESERFWRHLDDSGGFCRNIYMTLKVSGGIWNDSSDYWMILVFSGCFWSNLHDFRGIWENSRDLRKNNWLILDVFYRFLDVSGGCCSILKESGKFWRILEYSGKF